MQLIGKETESDVVLSKVKKFLLTGWPSVITQDVKIYYELKDCLNVFSESIIYRPFCRLVLPLSLRDRDLVIGHYGHRGIVRTKSFLRQFVF